MDVMVFSPLNNVITAFNTTYLFFQVFNYASNQFNGRNNPVLGINFRVVLRLEQSFLHPSQSDFNSNLNTLFTFLLSPRSVYTVVRLSTNLIVVVAS